MYCSTYFVSNQSFTVLHPRHKLQYFKNAGWDKEWIQAAANIVQEEFDRTYAFMETGVPPTQALQVCR